jgi:cytochrome P450
MIVMEALMIAARTLPPIVSINPWLFLRSSGQERIRQMMEISTVGPIVRLRMAHRTFWLIQKPDLVEYVLESNHRNYRKSDRYAELEPFLGKGLLTSEGDEWRRQRRRAQPTFNHKRLPHLAETMVAEARKRLERWDILERSGAPFDVQMEMMALTLSVVTRALYASELGKGSSDFGPALSTLLRLTDDRVNLPYSFPLWFPTPANLRFKHASAVLDRHVYEMIRARRTDPENGNDLLSMLMQARHDETGEPMSDAQLRAEIMTMVLAGHETTANALTWTWYLLSKSPSVERAVRAEVNDALGDRDPTFDDLPRLSLTLRVFQEAMRLYPPVWLFERQNVMEDVLGGFPIRPATRVTICPYVLHHLSEHWENPEGFDPDRFLPDRCGDRPKFAYVPFGGGPRICIGSQFAQMEAQIILAMTLQRYRLELDPTRTVEPALMLVLRPKNGLWVRLRRAEGASSQKQPPKATRLVG